MPKRVVETPEEEIELKKEQKKESYVTSWFKSSVVENPNDIRKIAELTAKSAEEQFCMYLGSGNYEVYAIVFYATFISICEFISQKQSRYSNFTIAIANSINIGYTNNEDENNEICGNFMPLLEYIGVNMDYINSSDNISSEKTASSCIGWKNLNIKQNAEYFKEIQERAYDKLRKEFKVDLRISEAIIPLFCIFMDHINAVLKVKFQEAAGTDVSEIKLNVMGLFDAYYSFNEESNIEIIEYTPNIRCKLALKNNGKSNKE